MAGEMFRVDERVIALIGRPQRLSSPTATLLAAMGLPSGLEDDVAVAGRVYQPHVPVSPAADRLVALCGGRTEESAARVCVLLQAHAATLALIARLEAGDGGLAVPTTRRIAPDGHEVLVGLAPRPSAREGTHALGRRSRYLAGERDTRRRGIEPVPD